MGQHWSKNPTGERKRTQRNWDNLISHSQISECSSDSDNTGYALRRKSRNACLKEQPIEVQVGRFNRIFKCFRRNVSENEFISIKRTGSLSTASKAIDVDECNSNPPLRPVLKSLDELVLCTRFSRHELQQMYRAFKNDCPTGYVNWEQFKKIYSDLFPCGDSSMYAKFIFNTFDSDQDGRITFEDFVTGMSSSMRGSLYEKLKWSFRLCDVDNDGVLTKEELSEVLDAVYKMISLPTTAADSPVLSVCICGDPAIEEQAEDIFKAMDVDGDGLVNEEQFITACLTDRSILRSLAFTADTWSLNDEFNGTTDDEIHKATRPYSTSSRLPRKFHNDLSFSTNYKNLERNNSLPIIKTL